MAIISLCREVYYTKNVITVALTRPLTTSVLKSCREVFCLCDLIVSNMGASRIESAPLYHMEPYLFPFLITFDVHTCYAISHHISVCQQGSI